MDKQGRSYGPMGEVFFALCKSVDSPVSLGVWLRFLHKEHLALAEKELNPRDYLDAESFKKDYAVTSLLSKYKGLVIGTKTFLRDEAIKRFITSEEHCLATNRSIRKARIEGFTKPSTGAIIHMATRKIARLLGQFEFRKVIRDPGWGPGATLDIPRRSAFVDTKMIKLPVTVSRSALRYAEALITNDLHWSAAILGCSIEDIGGPFSFWKVFSISDAARYDTVPKSAKTDRSIMVEPTMNGHLQKGVGSYIRRRLRTVGINLDDQSTNQELARFALDFRLATIDLQAASDSVSAELISMLLPPSWYDYLDDLRSKKVVGLVGDTVRLEKFSSMGNGFTFELESLIFWAISASVAEFHNDGLVPFVYGDDLICGQETAVHLIEVLAILGFRCNTSKTYIDGLFFESCGHHYFDNVLVTPPYQKEEIRNAQEHIRMANRLYRCAVRHVRNGHLPRWIKAAWLAAFRTGDSQSKIFRLPLGAEGDDGWLLRRADFGRFHHSRNHGIECVVFRTPSYTLPGHDGALLAHALRHGSPIFTRGDVTVVSKTSLVKGRRWIHPSGEFEFSW